MAREEQNNKNEELAERTMKWRLHDGKKGSRKVEFVERGGRYSVQSACPIGFSEQEARGRFCCKSVIGTSQKADDQERTHVNERGGRSRSDGQHINRACLLLYNLQCM